MHPLHQYRKSNGLTVPQLAKRLSVSVALVNKIAAGSKRTTPERAVRWHNLTGGALRAWELRPDIWTPGSRIPPQSTGTVDARAQ